MAILCLFLCVRGLPSFSLRIPTAIPTRLHHPRTHLADLRLAASFTVPRASPLFVFTALDSCVRVRVVVSWRSFFPLFRLLAHWASEARPFLPFLFPSLHRCFVFTGSSNTHHLSFSDIAFVFCFCLRATDLFCLFSTHSILVLHLLTPSQPSGEHGAGSFHLLSLRLLTVHFSISIFCSVYPSVFCLRCSCCIALALSLSVSLSLSLCVY